MFASMTEWILFSGAGLQRLQYFKYGEGKTAAKSVPCSPLITLRFQ